MRRALAVGVLLVAFPIGVGTAGMHRREPNNLAAKQELVRQIAAGLPGVRRVRLVIGHAPHDWPGVSDSRHWLRAWITSASEFRYLKLEWKTVLVAALARDIAARTHLSPPIAGVSRWRIERAGQRPTFDGADTLGHPFQTPVRHVSDRVLRTRVQRAAKRAKVKLLSLSVLKLLDRRALEITVETADPDDYTGEASIGLYELQRPCGGVHPGCEGEFIKVLDEQENILTESAFSVRTGIGMGITPNPS